MCGRGKGADTHTHRTIATALDIYEAVMDTKIDYFKGRVGGGRGLTDGSLTQCAASAN